MSSPKRTRATSALVLASTAALGVSTAAPRAEACAPAYPQGSPVQIAEETALIVWDAARKTQHFVRRASFRTEAKDFGFLVPTPTKPELAEAPDALFDELGAMIQPEVRVVEERGWIEPTTSCGLFILSSSRSAGVEAGVGAPVRVLDEKRVGGYDAVVLEADDPGALADWLKARGYDPRPALREWLKPYVESHWKVTAFKIAPASAPTPATSHATSAVRMSFTTERPFFPYREPTDQGQGDGHGGAGPASRLLRVFFLGDARVSGALGAAPGVDWPARTVWASPHAALAGIATRAAPTVPAGELWLTAFEDSSTPRRGADDLFFGASPASEKVIPPPHVITRRTAGIPIPIDLVLLAAGGIWLVARKRRRRT